MSDTPIFDQMVEEFFEAHSKPDGLVFVRFDSRHNAQLGDWLGVLTRKPIQPAAGGVVTLPEPHLPKEDIIKSKDELLVEAQNWRARYKSDSPYIGFK